MCACCYFIMASNDVRTRNMDRFICDWGLGSILRTNKLRQYCSSDWQREIEPINIQLQRKNRHQMEVVCTVHSGVHITQEKDKIKLYYIPTILHCIIEASAAAAAAHFFKTNSQTNLPGLSKSTSLSVEYHKLIGPFPRWYQHPGDTEQHPEWHRHHILPMRIHLP